MISREVAWRVFASELNESTLVLTGEEERAPSYVVTPLGAKINRVYMVGVITDLENAGTSEEPLWKARMADPTGTIYISAGQFQPEAAQALSKMPVPGFAAVIGKARTYSPEEGVIYISIRPEAVKTVSRELRDAWVLDSCKALKHRLDAVSEAKEMGEPSVDELMKLGYNQKLAEGVIAAMDHYGDIPLEGYQTMLVDALRYLIPEEGEQVMDVPEKAQAPEVEEEFDEDVAEPPVMEEQVEKPDEEGDDDDEELTDDEISLIQLIDEQDPESGGLDWDVLAKAAKKAGLKKDAFETAVEGLLDKGLVYEPMLGKIRKI